MWKVKITVIVTAHIFEMTMVVCNDPWWLVVARCHCRKLYRSTVNLIEGSLGARTFIVMEGGAPHFVVDIPSLNIQ